MRTGEGKTLVATLPAYLNALTGKGVFTSLQLTITLQKRDSEWMEKSIDFRFNCWCNPFQNGDGARNFENKKHAL